MNAYEYGLKHFSVKYQPQSNCVVFNDKYIIDGDEEEHTQSEYVPSLFRYIQVAQVSEKKYTQLANPKTIDADTVEDFLIPNNYVTITQDNTLEELPNAYVKVYEYQGNFYVRTEKTGTQHLEEVEITATRNKGYRKPKIFGLADIKLREILEDTSVSLIFFFTEDGAVLEKAYASIDTIEPNEIVFFLEKESLYNPISVAKIKVGQGITKDKQLPFDAIAKLAQLMGVAIEKKNVENIFKIHFTTEKEGTTTIVYQVGNYVFEVTSEVLRGLLGDPLVLIGNEFSKVFKANPNRWQYYNKDGSVSKKFTPFIPEFKEFLKSEEKKESSTQEGALTSTLTAVKEALNKATNKITNEAFRKLLVQKLNFIHKLLDELENLYQSFQKLISSKSMHIYFNALFVGVYNSVIEAIGGIITLVGHILNLPSYLMKTSKKTFSQSIAIGSELLENAIETFLKIFSIKNIKAYYSGIIKLAKVFMYLSENPDIIVSKLADGVNYTATKIDRLGYGMGYVVGFVIEEILTALATGGAKTIASAFKLTVEGLSKVVRTIKNTPNIVVNKASDFVQSLIALFKKLKQLDVVKLIDDLIVWIQQWIKTTRQLATEKFDSLFNFTEKYWLRKLNLAPTKFENSLLTLCPIKK
ncbi:hypothetical protein P8625_11795 [Tenacibaculum tangerinum]|uniref:Uncharacterized protein n=1 Tax=Tenacibaculum tangerinum TaxID=3038772 RepID=A0ABY8L3Q4_9FLAO|nr:hypothetical protein [Tenacibaculum tangerinum]WGH74760.1 hypothetical protein P8625_11795 [Tenacibaculum tangerinum]